MATMATMYEDHTLLARDRIFGVTRGAQVTGVAMASLCLSWLAVIARFYVRIGIQKMFGREDWLTAASMIVLTTLCALLLKSLQYGLGYHMGNIPAHDLVVLAKIIFSSEILYVATMTLTKLSIGFFFLRLAGRRYQVVIIYTVMVVVMVYSLLYFFFVLFQCQPTSYFWTQFDNSDGHCLPKDTLADVTYVHATMSAVTDWAFGLLPITFVWKLKMNPRTKLSVVLVLSLGFFASTATIVRIVYIRALDDTKDYSWEGINLTKWSLVEPAIAITAAGIATLRPLFQKFLFHRRMEDTYSVDPQRQDRLSMKSTGSTSGESYGEEFAQMMGLRRIGVTTLIFADRVVLSREGPAERAAPRLNTKLKGAPESESAQRLPKEGMEASSPVAVSPASDLDFDNGIYTTTIITHQISND